MTDHRTALHPGNALKTLKKLLKKLLRRGHEAPYTWDPSHDVITDYAEFEGIDVKEVERRIRDYKTLTRAEWLALPGRDFGDKARDFYGTSAYYICDILAANVSKNTLREKLDGYSPLFLNSIRNHPGKRFLEFGGGTGVFCELVADMGKDVTYLDIPGRQFEFAKWRFEKHGIPVKMQQTVPGELRLEGTFDILFTDAVMEHLDDPCTPTRDLCGHLAPGGIFIMLVDLSGEEEDMPMHKDVDIKALHATLSDAGLVCVHGHHQFASIWSKPA